MMGHILINIRPIFSLQRGMSGTARFESGVAFAFGSNTGILISVFFPPIGFVLWFEFGSAPADPSRVVCVYVLSG